MTNNYDDQPQPRDLDDRRYREEPIGSFQTPPARNMAEAAEIRSRLATNLRASVEEARNLTTFYDNFAQTLELCLSQLETKK